MAEKKDIRYWRTRAEALEAENVAIIKASKVAQERSRQETDEWFFRANKWKKRFEALSTAVKAMSEQGLAFQVSSILIKGEPDSSHPQRPQAMMASDDQLNAAELSNGRN